jgi:hypothetical protein
LSVIIIDSEQIDNNMKKLIFIIKENWKDPVWSKVFATVIITVSGFIIANTYALIKYLFQKIPFQVTFQKIFEYAGYDIQIKVWIIIILAIIYVILILKAITKFLNEIIFFRKNKKNSNEHTKKTELPRATEHSTSVFHYRMGGAFPGIRGIKWFDDPKVATKRLAILLHEPLRFSSGSIEAEGDPIWWFRGQSALFIEKFKKVGAKKILLNVDQLKIKRIAAYQGDSYYKDFVYVEVEGEKQTGLYNHTQEDIQRHIENFGYSSEEYGVLKNKLGWSTPIRREDYDDGATVVRGKVRNAMDAELRRRYLSTYNFIIAAKGSPYNSKKFCQESKPYLNGILKREVEPDAFFEFLNEFEKNEYNYR